MSKTSAWQKTGGNLNRDHVVSQKKEIETFTFNLPYRKYRTDEIDHSLAIKQKQICESPFFTH